MIDDICIYADSYAYDHIIAGSHSLYTNADDSWKDATSKEINRFIALMIYFGLVKTGKNVEKHWSINSLVNGLWASSIMGRLQFKVLMALLHDVDPGAETTGDKLHKVDSFVNYLKSRCANLYQVRQNLAINERMVKSRHPLKY